MTKITYPGTGRYIDYTYDKLDRLSTSSGGFGSHAYTYDAIGDRKKLHYGGGGFNGQVILRPNGPGSTTQWTKNGGGGANWDRVDEALTDGDATYVSASTNGNTDLYPLFDTSETGQVNSVTVTAVARGVWSSSCDPNCYAVLKLRVNGYASPVRYRGDFTAYAAASYTWTTNPATGQPWTIAEVNALQAGIEKSTGVGAAPTARVTMVNVTVSIGSDATYVYSDSATGLDQLTSMTDNAGATTTFGYDANGNLLSRFAASRTCYDWNPENLLTKVKSVPSACTEAGSQVQAYAYDGLGRRVKVDGTSASTWTVSIFSGMDPIFENSHVDGQADQITKYVYANGMRIAKITSSGGVQYYLGDHLGSTRKVLDASRNTVFSTDYEPFGKPYAVTGTESYKYTMEKHDDPTGLVYLRARQYDPEIGRFVSADPVLGSLSSPQTLNRYTYVRNSPLKYVDPSGEVLQILAGAIIGGLVGYGLCVWATGGWTSRQCGAAGLMGMAVGAFAVATFGLGMAAFGVGATGGIAAGSLAAVGAGVVTGAAVGAQSYFLASTLGIGLGTMTPEDLSMEDFAVSVGLGAAFGGVGGNSYNPKTYWSWMPSYHNTPERRPVSPHARWRMFTRHITPENADEVIGSGKPFYNPAKNSIVSAKRITDMRSPVSPQVRGRFIEVAQVPENGVIKTAFVARKPSGYYWDDTAWLG